MPVREKISTRPIARVDFDELIDFFHYYRGFENEAVYCSIDHPGAEGIRQTQKGLQAMIHLYREP